MIDSSSFKKMIFSLLVGNYPPLRNPPLRKVEPNVLLRYASPFGLFIKAEMHEEGFEPSPSCEEIVLSDSP